MARHIGFIVYPGVDLLDLQGTGGFWLGRAFGAGQLHMSCFDAPWRQCSQFRRLFHRVRSRAAWTRARKKLPL